MFLPKYKTNERKREMGVSDEGVSNGSGSAGSSAPPSGCNSGCLRRYGAFKDIPWRVYCKKACASDVDSWTECIEDCRALCHKDPIYKGKNFEWTAALDRSPGDRFQSRRCDKACLRGCAFKFQVTPELLATTIPAKIARPQTPGRHNLETPVCSDPPLSTSA